MHVQRHRVQGIVDTIGVVAPDVAGEIPIVECYINDAEGTRAAARMLLDTHPELTAVACTTDSLAIAVMQHATERGWSVPGDLSVTGFDGIDVAVDQGITTISQPNKDKGQAAGHVLQMMIRDVADDMGATAVLTGQVSTTRPSRMLLDTTLIPGRTVGPPR